MSYPRNAASPPVIAVGAIYLLADGTIQTTGASARVKTGSGAWGTAAGTLACDSTSGVWTYTPTQSETDAESFLIAVYKAASTSAQVTIATSASATAGYSGVDWSKLTSATSTVNLSGTTISTSQAVASVSGSVGSVTGAVGSVTAAVTVGTNNDKTGYSLSSSQTFSTTGSVGSVTGAVGSVTGAVGSVTAAVTVGTNSDKTGYSLTAGTGLGNQTANITGSLSGSVGSVSGSVGSISGVTFPTHFHSLDIAANGHVSAVVQSIANNSITASSIQGGAITAAKFAADAITASALAADAVTEIQTGLATSQNLLIVSDRVSYGLAVLIGACSNAQTAAETYTLTIGGNTFTVDYSGLDASGNRSATTLSKA